jgi:hypothetical protein
VFINYRTMDHPAVAAVIHDDMVARFGADRVFRDCQSLGPGQWYPAEIRKSLASADVLVAVIGPRWLSLTDPDTGQRLIDREYDWVRREIVWALEWHTPVVPVLLRDTPENASRLQCEQLPECLQPLATIQVAEVSQRRLREDLDALAAALVTQAPALKNEASGKVIAQQGGVATDGESAPVVVNQRARVSGHGRAYQAGRDMTVGD